MYPVTVLLRAITHVALPYRSYDSENPSDRSLSSVLCFASYWVEVEHE